MAIVQTATRNRYDEFSAAERDSVVERMMRTGMTTRQEFAASQKDYEAMGICDVDTLHTILSTRATKYWAALVQYFNKLRPIRDKLSEAIEDRETSAEQKKVCAIVLQGTLERENFLTERGFILDDDSVVYRKLTKGRESATVESSVSSLDDVLAGNALDFLNLDDLEEQARSK